jgi:hypothetical protein
LRPKAESMIDDVFIIGVYSTAAGRFADRGPKDLVRDAYVGVLADARLDPGAIGHVWFSNMLLDFWGHWKRKLRPGRRTPSRSLVSTLASFAS